MACLWRCRPQRRHRYIALPSTGGSTQSMALRRPQKLQVDSSESTAGSPLYTSLRAIIPAGEQQQQQAVAAAAGSVGDDAKRKSGRRSRMMDLGKKMGDKLEEKGRHIVEKMRENARTNSMARTTSA